MKQKLISHRGNIFGPNPKLENNPLYIEFALDLGFDVEIDVWIKDDRFYLGHDEPQYEVSNKFLIKDNLWIHAKNLEALSKLRLFTNIRYFWHDQDLYTLTSNHIIWSYPGAKLNETTICVLPERCGDDYYLKEDLEGCYGICSDYIEKYFK